MSEKLSRREFVQTSTAAATVALGAAPAFGAAMWRRKWRSWHKVTERSPSSR